jgi:hypothetical protein
MWQKRQFAVLDERQALLPAKMIIISPAQENPTQPIFLTQALGLAYEIVETDTVWNLDTCHPSLICQYGPFLAM